MLYEWMYVEKRQMKMILRISGLTILSFRFSLREIIVLVFSRLSLLQQNQSINNPVSVQKSKPCEEINETNDLLPSILQSLWHCPPLCFSVSSCSSWRIQEGKSRLPQQFPFHVFFHLHHPTERISQIKDKKKIIRQKSKFGSSDWPFPGMSTRFIIQSGRRGGGLNACQILRGFVR